MTIENLLDQIISLPKEEITSDNVKALKRKFAKENKIKDLPTNIQILKMYKSFIKDGKTTRNPDIENVLKKRAIRSMSGIVPIQVLTKPYFCPGKCIFCPTDISMPKSYINTEPGAMRALLNNFDPYKQVYNRILSLTITGHATDKIEMIVLGGTWDVYPNEYKTEFVKGLYDACNTFDQFYSQIEIDADNPKSAKFTINDNLDIKYSSSLEEAQAINENSNHRIIGLTVETRPEYVTDKNCQFWRNLGVTRLEIGVQSMFDDVLDANKRGNSVQQVRDAFHKLRQYGFKISAHFMPGLYQSTVEKDIDSFRMAYEDPFVKPDEIKFYPTSVIPNTELYDLYRKGEYKPLKDEEIEHIIKEAKLKYIPSYTRIKRLIRDIPSTEIVAGSNVTNLRQIVMDKMMKSFQQNEDSRKLQYARLWENYVILSDITEIDSFIDSSISDSDLQTFVINKDKNIIDESSLRNFICLCTRCREIRNKGNFTNGQIHAENNNIIVIRKYMSSVGEEYFISFEDSLGYLYGFTRLLLPDDDKTVEFEGVGEGYALIRELHVYGQLAKIGEGDEGKTQHKGIGGQLMEAAEIISSMKKYKKVSVISGIGVRGYYKKLGYELEGTYMVKSIQILE